VIQRVVATPLPPLFSRPASTLTAPLAPDRPGLLTVRRTFDSVEAGAPAAEPVTVQRIPAAGLPERVAPMPQLDVASARVPAPFREVVVAPAPAPRTMPPLVAPAPVAALAPLAPAVQRITPAAQDFVAYSQFAAPPATRLEQRATAVPDVPVQRETAGGEEPGGASAPVAAAGSGLAAAEAPGHSDKDLDDLARKLYDRVSLNLRRDLLIQRERAGLVHDWR
jgi:hypothetical protein